MRRVLPSLACALLLACEAKPEPQALQPETASARAAAIVDGRVIELAEVERFSRESGLPPRRALARLVQEHLLVQHAEAGGYAALPSVERGVARARVRAVLAELVERELPERDVAGRRQRLATLLTELRARTPVVFDEAGLRTLAELGRR